ncbi:phage replisome organizer N-terminal domain-containing protein [Mediterraneibacter gnavus]|uniref:phage replisome organizer N-terminal domain-containing protein n=1 Tax=Mediterraneibacter gnavus TaxID=33038 RepID=UPI000463C80E|nr:phage replisome organizer N-terminal domain-containing protein [Mediterraneibacter gnavus]
MAKVKWIKITTDMFDNCKIKHLRKLPDGNNIVLIWVMLLTMAGRCNSNGMVFLTQNIPYTPKMLADELDFEENTVKLALQSLEQLEMIVMDNGFFTIPGWEEHQNAEALEKIREQNRIRKQKQREKQKIECVTEMSRDTGVTNLGSHATDIDKDIDIDIDIDKDIDIRGNRVDYQQIADMYNATCVSFPRLTVLSKKREKAIKARLRKYSIDDIQRTFELAEESDFLKGANNRNWSATFDWMMNDANMAKILDGNYKNKDAKQSKPPVSRNLNNFDRRNYDMDSLEEQLLNSN